MMGIHQPENNLFAYRVNLEKRVRADHPLRRINAILDLSFVRPAVASFYGNNGHVGLDPVVLVKMMLVMFLDDVASERELVEVIRERLDYLWFLGYGLDDEVPHHSVLSKARARWGSEVFCQLFVRTVEQCVAAGLVDGKKLHIDSSLVRANASKDSLVKASPELVAALRQAYAQQEQKLEPLEPEAVNARHISTTDPEATLGKGGGSAASQLSYKHHRVVDDAQGVITAVQTTTGCTGDAGQLPELVEQHEKNTGGQVSTAIGDKHYGSAENYRYCQQRQIAAHLGQAQAHVKGYPVSAFVYESEHDRYRCPAGHYLYYHNFKKEEQLIEYKIEQASLCANCKLRSQCTKSKTGRSVTRPLFSEQVEAGRAQANSPAARQDRRRRKYLMEGSFADAANNHGFKHARWRGLWRQQIQDWLIAAVQNLRILFKRGWKWAGEGEASGILSLIVWLRTLFVLRLFWTRMSWPSRIFIAFSPNSLDCPPLPL
jgi:transposase